MYRVRDYGGMIVAHLSLALILFSSYIINRVNIFYWFRQRWVEKQDVHGIPLTREGLTYFLVFNGLCLITILCFFRVSLADPGKVPEGLTAPFKSEFTRMETCSRYNNKDTWKPSRAHYCTSSKAYIFKLDHYCPWINNSIGHWNSKFYIQFLYYLLLTSLVAILLISRSILGLILHARAKIVMGEH